MPDTVRFYESMLNGSEDAIAQYEIKETERKLKLVNKDIKGDIIKVSIGVTVAVAGVFGVVHFGKDLLDLYNSNEALTFQTKFLADWLVSGTTASAFLAGISGYATVGYARSCKENIRDKKTYTKKLTDLKNTNKDR